MKPVLAAFFLLSASPALADDAGDMKAVASAFYSAAISQPAGGAPNPALMARLTPLLSASLNAALKDAVAAEARWATRNKIVPPLIEGNIFTSLFEGATGFAVGECRADAASACSVDLVYDDRKASPTRWTDRAMLVKEGGGWRLDNIAYGGKWPFANSGTLRQTLATATGMAP